MNGSDWRDINMFKYIIWHDGGWLRDSSDLGYLYETEEEAREHPRRNVLMRALGTNMSVEMDIFDVETDVDGILLCSDGLTNMVADDQIEKVLNNKSSIEEQVEKLIKKSNMRGGTDNISIAYLKKESGDL